MKRTALIIGLTILLAGLSAAIVNGNKTRSGDLSITSGGSASATTGVNENGTVYSIKVETSGQDMNNTEDWIGNATFPHSGVKFQGRIRAPTPCHVIQHDVNKTDNQYVLNIETVKESLDNSTEVCSQVVTGINYDAEFEADAGFQLEIRHNNQTVETYSDRVVEKEPQTLLEQILGLLGL